jgi:hypothetical protein
LGPVHLASYRARLAEQVLLDRVQQEAAAELRAADPKGEPLVAVCWQRDGSATIGTRTYTGRDGALQLVSVGVAQVLVDSGAAVLRETLTLPAGQRPEVAAELQDIAHELLAAAAELDPTGPVPERQGVL